MSELFHDLQFGLRLLWKRPGFAAAAIITLALGIGANTAIFSVVNGVLLRPLPYPQPNRLVMVYTTNSRYDDMPVSYPNFLDWKRDSQSFQNLAAVIGRARNIAGPGASEHVAGKDVSAGYFSALGVKFELGRTFLPQEDAPGGNPVVIISHRLWKQRFGGSLDVLGKTLSLDGKSRTIVGVLPPGFHLRRHADVYTPVGQDNPSLTTDRSTTNFLVMGRLKPGVTLAQARAEMKAVQRRLDARYPTVDADLSTEIIPLKDDIVGKTGKMLFLLLGAVGLVLLIACANVASLLLARSSAREKEFAVRSALGASRRRVLRQLLTESVVLGLIGGGVALIIAKWGVRPILAAVPGGLPRSQNIGLDLTVLGFTFGVAILAGIFFGLAPAFRSSHVPLQESLQAGGRGTTGGRHRAQKGLVIFEVALTLVLLVAAGLMIQTIRRLWRVNPGFNPRDVLTFEVSLPPAVARSGSEVRMAYQQLLDRIRRIPGVESAALTWYLPLSGNDSEVAVWSGQQVPSAPQKAPWALLYLTTAGYLHALEIPLLQGRFFTPQDTPPSPAVAVIDRTMAHRLFHHESPLGRKLTLQLYGRVRVVGVAAHVKHFSLAANPYPNLLGAVYFPWWQIPDSWMKLATSGMMLVLRTRGRPADVLAEVRRTLGGAAGGDLVYRMQTMEQIVARSLASRRFPMLLFAIFAALALVLAAVGIYGVVSYSVSRRTNEIGIRMALGAQRADVLRMVVGQGMVPVLIGVAIGIASGLALTRLLAKLLYGVHPGDPATFAVVAVVLCAVALVACYIPARRAASVDPMIALRYE